MRGPHYRPRHIGFDRTVSVHRGQGRPGRV